MKKYIIKYTVELDGADPIKDKEIKIDNCLSDLHAKSRLEDYLKRKYINFKRLMVHSCHEDLFSKFGDIFGGDLGSFFSGYRK